MDVMRDARTMRRWTDEQHLYKVFKIITMFVLREDSKDEKRNKKKKTQNAPVIPDCSNHVKGKSIIGLFATGSKAFGHDSSP
jgi:hypothetical protein